MALLTFPFLLPAIFSLLFILGYIATFNNRRKPGKGLRSVPGPKGLPIVGNTLQLGPQPQRMLKLWADQYGEIFQIRLGLENWVFLNSPRAVKDILDKQSAITSGRAPMPVANDIVSGGMRFLLMSYSPTWRKLRAIVHKLLTPKVSNTFMPSQEFEAKQLVYDLLTDNEDEWTFYMHVRRYTTSVVMTTTYGRRVATWVSPSFDQEHKKYG
jgi:cytochrome P450